MNTAVEKKALRREILTRLRSMSDEEYTTASAILCAKLAEDEEFKGASLVASFCPLGTELDPSEATAASGVDICLPRVAGEGMLVFHRVHDRSELAIGSFGVMEPVPDLHPAVPAGDIDVILVPGLAFDPVSGGRLGRGGGFYDRFLAAQQFRATSIGICHTLQLHTGIPLLEHDVHVDRLIDASGKA